MQLPKGDRLSKLPDSFLQVSKIHDQNIPDKMVKKRKMHFCSDLNDATERMREKLRDSKSPKSDVKQPKPPAELSASLPNYPAMLCTPLPNCFLKSNCTKNQCREVTG